ncbi:hypothetical protein HMPREF9554_02205 [Treponema phagedenis F0421]|nr:hypothetical protein HMPREF9554_02205 [Treponema phagedenis F0421]
MLWLKRRHQCKNDVLKQNYLQSFKTRKVSFCLDGKNETVVPSSFSKIMYDGTTP